MIQSESNFGKNSLKKMLDQKTQDDEQKVRVMKRVKLMLDPKGQTHGRDLPLEELANMTEEQRQAYEAE